jgi:hypothetical protein
VCVGVVMVGGMRLRVLCTYASGSCTDARHDTVVDNYCGVKAELGGHLFSMAGCV